MTKGSNVETPQKCRKVGNLKRERTNNPTTLLKILFYLFVAYTITWNQVSYAMFICICIQGIASEVLEILSYINGGFKRKYGSCRLPNLRHKSWTSLHLSIISKIMSTRILLNPGWFIVVVPPMFFFGYWNGTPQFNSRLGFSKIRDWHYSSFSHWKS